MTLREKEAFIAGFMATSEGYNGEYPGSLSNDAHDEAAKRYEMWACDHEFGGWEFSQEVPAGERWIRRCQHCPMVKGEIRRPDE